MIGSDHPEALTERARISRLLDHWSTQTDEQWPGVEPGHSALLRHLSTVFAPPEENHR